MTKREFKVGDRVAFDIQVYAAAIATTTLTWPESFHTLRKRGTVTSIGDLGELWIHTDTSRILFKREVRDVKRLVRKQREKSVRVTRNQLKQALWANSYIRSMNLEKFHDFYTELCKQLELG